MDEVSNSTTVVTTLAKILPSRIMFSWYDYILFTVMLLFSALIGIYFGCFGTKQSTTSEYLMGGKKMKVLPIAISLVASHTSGITLLALPADVYRYGAGYWLGAISMVLLCIVTSYVYLPVFFKLQITSTYEYLERRFDRGIRQFASFLYALSVLLYLPIVVYIPALAFSAATGIGVHYITPIVCGICIFYTTIGGLKAVVWTDTLQFTVTVAAVTTVFIMGTMSVGGFSVVWSKAVDSGRLDIFNFDFDPTQRDSFWIIIFGLTTYWMGHTSVNQSCLQKFLSVPTFRDSVWSLICFAVGMTIIKTISVLTGLLMYTKYSGCDPFTTKEVQRNDQLLPYYVMDVAKNIPGLSGLFIAGIFSAALSTLSATLNCLSGTLYEDFISKILIKNASEKRASNILKTIVIITGVICTSLVLIIEHLGGLLALSISLGSITNGALLGMFTLGMIFPKANAKGALCGGIAGMIFVACIALPTKYYQSQGLFKYPPKPLSTDQCDFNNQTLHFLANSLLLNTTTTPFDYFNTTEGIAEESIPIQPHFMFRISFYYYTLIGSVVTIIIGLVVSYMTNKDDPPVDKMLISPVSYGLLPKVEIGNNSIQYNNVEKALDILVIDKDEK